jgi:hypothetical protein
MTISKKALLKLLGDRPVAYHPMLAKALGGVIEAVFVSQLLYWYDKGKLEDNWIWKTQAEWEDETGLTRSNQETARRNLKKLGILKEQRKGVPGKIHFQLDLDRLADLLTMLDFHNVETLQSIMPEPGNVQCEDSANYNAETAQSIPENTINHPEITPERSAAEKTPPPAPSRNPSFLPSVQEQLPTLFPDGREAPDYEQVIQRSGWRINNTDHRRALALFLEVSQLDIPFDKSARGDWLKQIDIHLKTYGLDRLRNMYPRIISEMREDGLSICRPGSLTNPLADLRARDKHGNGKQSPGGIPITPVFLED